MNNETLLKMNMREVLADNCTGEDDHDSGDCEKCEDMETDLFKAVQEWFKIAYKEKVK
jgi:hypothetical protein